MAAHEQWQLEMLLRYMVARERVRQLREHGVSQAAATDDEVLRATRLCNVHRHRDPTTRVIASRVLEVRRAVQGPEGAGAAVFTAALLQIGRAHV